VLISSAELGSELLPADTTVWLRGS
jgi:hypothetical protein